MSRTVSASSNRAYGAACVMAIWDLPRSSFYAARSRERNPREPRKRGPKVLSDADLLSVIRVVLEEAVFSGEGNLGIHNHAFSRLADPQTEVDDDIRTDGEHDR
jgi:hypothetical protein